MANSIWNHLSDGGIRNYLKLSQTDNSTITPNLHTDWQEVWTVWKKTSELLSQALFFQSLHNYLHRFSRTTKCDTMKPLRRDLWEFVPLSTFVQIVASTLQRVQRLKKTKFIWDIQSPLNYMITLLLDLGSHSQLACQLSKNWILWLPVISQHLVKLQSLPV